MIIYIVQQNGKCELTIDAVNCRNVNLGYLLVINNCNPFYNLIEDMM
jgi:hypothetical protein